MPIDDDTMEYARKRFAEDWTPDKYGKYLQKNIDVVLGYGIFQKHQDGYQALSMIQALAEKLNNDQKKLINKCDRCGNNWYTCLCSHCDDDGC